MKRFYPTEGTWITTKEKCATYDEMINECVYDKPREFIVDALNIARSTHDQLVYLYHLNPNTEHIVWELGFLNIKEMMYYLGKTKKDISFLCRKIAFIDGRVKEK